MAANNMKGLVVIVGVVLIIFIIVYLCKNKSVVQENYLHAGAIDNLGSIETSYEMVTSPDEAVPAPNFADLVDDGNHPDIVSQPKCAGDDVRPMERLNRIHNRCMLPKIAAGVTPYQVDVANTNVFSFATQAPRVYLGKNFVAQQADMYRGDIPITYSPDVPLISKSHWERDSAVYDGFFSDHFNAMYHNQTGQAYVNMCNKNSGKAFKNMPYKVAAQGTLMDYGN